MCSYQTLYQDEKTGYVIRCAECKRIQLSYGNLLLTFDAKEFGMFRWWLQKIRNNHHPSHNELMRCLAIPTPREGIKLLLCLRELDELNGILESADSELQSLELIKLFQE